MQRGAILSFQYSVSRKADMDQSFLLFFLSPQPQNILLVENVIGKFANISQQCSDA